MRAEPRGRPTPPSSGLPAPYQNPWKRLGADLEAVGADLVLRARELWRRNGEGNLWHPGFWPRSWAAGFWPLVLVAVLTLAGLAVALASRSGTREPGLASPAPELESPAAVAAPAAAPQLEEPPLSAPVPAEEPLPEAPPAAEPEPEPEAEREPAPAPSPQPGPDQALREPFAALEDPDLIVALRPDAATAVLQLEVGEGFARLEPRRRRRLAEDWAVVAAERGYDRLEVVDGRGRLWARPAAVGGGLVVLAYPLAPEPR